jgi:glycosyltransferase involved in cell wall biosynthesis
MIKIFQFISSIQLGGAEMIAFNLSEFCNSESPNSFEFVVVELLQTNDYYSMEKKKELRLKNIRVISLGTRNKAFSLLIGPFMLFYYLLIEKPDVIHSHTDLPDLVLSNTKRFFSIFHIKFPKIIRTIHNTVLWPTHNKLGKYVETGFTNDWIVGVSESAIESYRNLRNKYNLNISNHLFTIYNGCVIPPKSEHPFEIDNQKINIAFCGRFEDQKGIDILIERIKVINSKFNDHFVFHLIGKGTYLNDVLKLAKANPNVIVYESVPNISEKLYAFDFLIMPSRFEGLVLISIEASYSKVPVIAAMASGLSETLPKDWPLLFHLENEIELLAILEKIKNNEYDLKILKNQAFLFVSQKFSHSGMIDAYSKLYLEMNE